MRIALFFVLLFTRPVLAQVFSSVDRIIQKGIEDQNYPGACVIVGSDSEILYHRAYGRMTYDPHSAATDTSLLFDLASLTKVIATTSCIMKLYESDQIQLDSSVASYLPQFGQNGKQHITIRNCLLHNSGLPAYYTPAPNETANQILNTIYRMGLAYQTGSKTIYSCLNFVTLAKVVDAVSGKNISQFLQEQICVALGLQHCLYKPPENMQHQCMPTLRDRQGQVHDPLAYGLGGLSGNAGLFSTTSDLALMAQLYLNQGIYRGIRIFEAATIEQFTRKQFQSSSRALGWDTKSATGYSSAGTRFSAESFGHTGYTGTSIWIDPVRKLFLIFLTNRTYPNSSGSMGNVRDIRPQIADAVVRILEGNPGDQP